MDMVEFFKTIREMGGKIIIDFGSERKELKEEPREIGSLVKELRPENLPNLAKQQGSILESLKIWPNIQAKIEARHPASVN